MSLKPKIIPLKISGSLFEIFKRIEPAVKHCFFFESLGPNKDHLSRYSILGFNPETLIRGRKKHIIVGSKKIKTADPYKSLRELMPQGAGSSDEYSGGLTGYFSYEAANLFEPSLKLKTSKDFDLFCFGIFTDGIIYDHLTGETKYFYYRKNRFSYISRVIAKSKKGSKITVVAKLGQNLDLKGHARMVKKVLKQIKLGNIFQCEVGLRKKYIITGGYLPIYESLRNINPSPYLYYIKFGSQTLLGSSPELLLSVKNGQMETFPLAGTVKRGKDLKEDQKLAKKLLNDEKEQAEHKMLVDLHRNDLGRVAKFGSVVIKKFMDIKKFSHVQHISSEISGLLKADADMFDAFKSCFPAGTLTGAPKIEAMKIINSQEPEGRGPYGGAVGFFGFNGNCEFAIPIRSLFAFKEKAYIQACGGIVKDSVPKTEFEEISNKLKALDIVLDKFKEPLKLQYERSFSKVTQIKPL